MSRWARVYQMFASKLVGNIEKQFEAPHIVHLKMPGGLPYQALSSSGTSINPWITMQLNQGVTIAASYGSEDSFLDFPKMPNALVTPSTRYVTHPDLQKESLKLINSCINWRVEVSHVGSTSFTLETQVSEHDSKNVLFSIFVKLVSFDMKTGKTVPLPKEFRDKYGPLCYGGESLFLEPVDKRGSGSAISDTRFIVKHSDLDLFQHAGYSMYVREVVNSISLGIKLGRITSLEKEQFMSSLLRIDITFSGQAVEGDDILVEIWEDVTRHFTFSITNMKAPTVISSGSIEFGGPKVSAAL